MASNALCIDFALSLASPSPPPAVDDPKDIETAQLLTWLCLHQTLQQVSCFRKGQVVAYVHSTSNNTQFIAGHVKNALHPHPLNGHVPFTYTLRTFSSACSNSYVKYGHGLAENTSHMTFYK